MDISTMIREIHAFILRRGKTLPVGYCSRSYPSSSGLVPSCLGLFLSGTSVNDQTNMNKYPQKNRNVKLIDHQVMKPPIVVRFTSQL